MRMGAFLLGGIVGAACVMYLSKNKGMMITSWDQAGQTVGKMMKTAKHSMQHAAMGALDSTLSRKTEKQSDMEQIEQIVNEDPELKNQVNKILSH